MLKGKAMKRIEGGTSPFTTTASNLGWYPKAEG